MKKSLCSILLVISLIFSSIPNISFGENLDTPSNWAISIIKEVEALNLNTPNTTSNYQSNISREEFCELVVNLYSQILDERPNLTISNPFTDTTNEDVILAYQLGIVGGTSIDKFSPTELASREHVATMLVNMLNQLENEHSILILDNSNLNNISFTDENEISDWSKNSIKNLYKIGVLSGYGNGIMKPKNLTTKEQSLALVLNIYKLIKVDKKEATLDTNVTLVTESKSEKLEKTAIVTEITTTGEVTIQVEDFNTYVPNAKVGTLVYLPPTDNNPYGYAGKIKNINTESTVSIITFESPTFAEFFDTVDIDFTTKLDYKNLISVDIPDTAYMKVNEQIVYTNGKNISLYNPMNDTAALGTFYGNVNGTFEDGMDIVLGFKDSVIHDFDNNILTEFDQIKAKGEVSLEELKVDVDFKYSIKGIERVKLILDTELKSELSIYGEYKNETNLGKTINQIKSKDTEYYNPNGINVDLGDALSITLSGVDMSDTVILGSLTFGLGAMPLQTSTGDISKAAIAGVVMLTMDAKGEISATVSLNSQDYWIAKYGVDYHNHNVTDAIEGDSRLSLNNNTLELYHEFHPNYEEEFKNKGELEINGTMEYEASIGPEVGLMIAGIMPIVDRLHIGSNISANANGKATTQDGNTEFDGTFNGGSSIFADLNIALEASIGVQLKTWFGKLEHKSGFNYENNNRIILGDNTFGNDTKRKDTFLLSQIIDLNSPEILFESEFGAPNSINYLYHDFSEASKENHTLMMYNYDDTTIIFTLEGYDIGDELLEYYRFYSISTSDKNIIIVPNTMAGDISIGDEMVSWKYSAIEQYYDEFHSNVYFDSKDGILTTVHIFNGYMVSL